MHLGHDAVDRRPVVPQVGRALLHLLAGRERGHRAADPVERALRRGAIGLAAAASASAARSARLICSHWRLTSLGGPRLGVAEHVRVAAHDLGADRALDVGQVEDALLGRELRVEHDLEQQVAELAGQGRAHRVAERVVDLVGLLEQVPAQGLVRLLAIPGAAVRLAQPPRDPGQRPRRPSGACSAEHRPDVDPAAQRGLVERVDRGGVHEPEPPDGMRRPGRARGAGRADRGRPGHGVRAAAPVRGSPVGFGSDRIALTDAGRRRHDARPRTPSGARISGRLGLDRGRQQVLDGDDLEPAREVEGPAELRFVDQRVEHGDAA